MKKVFKEIIGDVERDYEYAEYEVVTGDFSLRIVLNRNHCWYEAGDIVVSGTNGELEFAIVLPLLTFMVETLEQFEMHIAQAIYYVAVPIEVVD